jgi:hypothetical protein
MAEREPLSKRQQKDIPEVFRNRWKALVGPQSNVLLRYDQWHGQAIDSKAIEFTLEAKEHPKAGHNSQQTVAVDLPQTPAASLLGLSKTTKQPALIIWDTDPIALEHNILIWIF